MSDLQELPLFPLHTVLFPGMPLPLHIFEERYKLMINQSIQQATPFGVVLIREGEEIDEAALPYHIGTSALVTQAERLPDGRMNIHTIGYQRFRIHRFKRDKPYLVGLVEDFPLEEDGAPPSTRTLRAVRQRLEAYLLTLVDVLDVEYDFDNIPDEPVSLAFLTAIVLNLPADEKQDLLAIPDLRTLLRTEARLLSREKGLLEFMLTQEALMTDEQMSPFSIN
jgi:Lon protease-like protein